MIDRADAHVFWNVIPLHTPLHTPRVVKDCPKCRERRRFVSSDKFRINAQQRHLDVWLIYKCEKCATTWNSRILRRVEPALIRPNLYRGFLENDRETAWQYACNLDLLKRNGVEIDTELDFVIEGAEPPWDRAAGDNVKITVEPVLLAVEGRCRAGEADAIIAQEARTAFREGGLKLSPPVKSLRSTLREPTLVEISLSQLSPLRPGEEARKVATGDRDDPGGE